MGREPISIGQGVREVLPGIKEDHGRRRIDLRDKGQDQGGFGAERRDHGNATGKLAFDHGAQQWFRRQPPIALLQARDLYLDDVQRLGESRRSADSRFAVRHDDTPEDWEAGSVGPAGRADWRRNAILACRRQERRTGLRHPGRNPVGGLNRALFGVEG
jgi:hypothetical protein